MFSRPFDDLAVGQRFTTRGRTITEADVVGFATLTGDHHPQHVDARWAAESPFGARIAHGLLVLSYAAGMVPFDPERVVALRRVKDVVFKRPVGLGDTISVEGRIADVTELDAGTGLVAVALNVCGDDGRTAARATVEVLWRRDAVAAAPVDDGEEDAAAPVEVTGMVHALSSVPL